MKLSPETEPDCLTRRGFLLFAGASTVSIASLGLKLPGGMGLQPVSAQVAEYPRRKIASLSELETGTPHIFRYPHRSPLCMSALIRLGVEAGGGVGPDRDIVAFNQICTHQGMPMAGVYNARHQVMGPCPLHLTTFDARRHGMVVSGHATQGLPQVLLEIEGDDIHAVGMLGLMYGYADNRMGL